jgi:hypothetical protein
MVGLIFLFLNLVSSLFKSKSRLEAENAALRQQLTLLQRIGERMTAPDSGQYTAGSPLSVGLATTFLKASLIGTLRLRPLGGIGLRNHLS